MPHPFITLGVSETATDEEVRRAYLDLLRRFPPETHPVQFQAVSEAYEKIKTEIGRARIRLFGDVRSPSDQPSDLLPPDEENRRRPGREAWVAALRSSGRG